MTGSFDLLNYILQVHPRFQRLGPLTTILDLVIHICQAYHPFFSALLQRYLPIFYNNGYLSIDEDEYQDFPTCNGKKPMVIVNSNLTVSEVVAGAIEKIIKTPTYFNSLCTVSLSDSCFTFDEVKCVLKGCTVFHAYRSKFTEPVTFSELWPFLTYCDDIELDISNMIYDENIGQTMQNHRGVKLIAIELYNLPLHENILMSIIDYLLSFSEFPYRVEMCFPAEIAVSELQLFLIRARRAMEDAGYKCEDTDDHIEFKYDHLSNKISLTSDIKYIIVNTLYGQDGTRFMFTPPFGRKFLFTEPGSDLSREESSCDGE